MFFMPSLVVMTITSTRMYRFLADFGSATEVYGIHLPFVIRRAHCTLCRRSATDSGTLPRVGRAVGKLAFASAPPTPPQLTEVVVHIRNEQYQSALTDQDSHDIDNSRSEQLHDKPHNLSFDNDLERGV